MLQSVYDAADPVGGAMAAKEISERPDLDSSGYLSVYFNINSVTTLPDSQLVRLKADQKTVAYAQFQEVRFGEFSDFDTFVMKVTNGVDYRVAITPEEPTAFEIVSFGLYVPEFVGGGPSNPVAGVHYSEVVTAPFSGDVYVTLAVTDVSFSPVPTTGYTIELITVGGQPTPPAPQFSNAADKVKIAHPGKYAALGGNDIVTGSNGKDIISGGSGNDRLKGMSGSDTLNGNGGEDKLFGGGGRDKLKGGGGKDKLFGDDGNDKLRGGSSGDEFHFARNGDKDVIKDWGKGDILVLNDNLWSGDLSAKQLIKHFAERDHGDVLFDFLHGDMLVIEDASLRSVESHIEIL